MPDLAPSRTLRRLSAVVCAATLLCVGAFAPSVSANASAALEASFTMSSFTGLPAAAGITDFSGATVDGAGYLWTVDNSTAEVFAYRYTNGAWSLVRTFSIASVGNHKITDPESITWITGSRFAIVDEATNALHYFNFANAAPVRERFVPLGENIPIPTVNRGIEAVAYDHDASTASVDVFYVGVEDPATLYRVEVAESYTVKKMPLDIPEIAGLEKVSGSPDLYIVSEADKSIYRTTTTGQTPVKIGSASQFAQPEGIALDGDLLYLVGEQGKYEREMATFRNSGEPAPPHAAKAVIDTPTTSEGYALQAGANDVQESIGHLNDSTNTLSLNSISKVGLRIPDVCVDSTQTIVEATLTLVAATAETERTVATVRADTSTDPALFSDSSLVSRQVTSSSTRWVMPSTVRGSVIKSPDISGVLTEVTSAQDWSGCGDIVLILQGTGSRAFYSYDWNESNAAVLHVKTVDVPSIGDRIPDPAPGTANTSALVGAFFAPSSGPVAPAPESTVPESTSTTLDWRLAGGDRDRERIGDRSYSTSSDLDLASRIDVTVTYEVCVPSDATIDHAEIEFTAAGDDSIRTETTIRAGIDGAWSPTAVDWTIDAWHRGDQDRTPNLTPTIAAITASGDWEGCGDIDFHFTSTGNRQAHSFDGSPEDAPRLVVSYS